MSRHIDLILCFWIFLCASCLVPSTVSGDPGQRWAFLIGIDGYFDLTPLTSSSSDAIELGKVLTKRCNFDANHVTVVTDGHPSEAGRIGMLALRHRAIESRLRRVISEAERQNAQTLLIYFSGHGCLAPTADGSQSDDLLLPAIDAAEVDGKLINAISRNELQNLIAKADIPEKLLILDCCHAARPEQIPVRGKAFSVQPRRGKSEPPKFAQLIAKPEASRDSTFAILAGSTFEQIASEQVFTKHLIRGLQMTGNTANDSDDSRAIELDELFKHVRSTMGREVSQQPAMQLVSGKADNIELAPAVIVPDPPRLTRINVLSPNGDPIQGGSVVLVFKDNNGGQLISLGRATTDGDGIAAIRYQFRGTRDQSGRYQVAVKPPGAGMAASTTTLTGFTSSRSPSLYRVTAYSGAKPKPQPVGKRSFSILERTPVEPKEPTFQETLAAVIHSVKEREDIPDICTFKEFFPEYKQLIDGLGAAEKLQIKGMLICFPSEAIWTSQKELRAKIIRILRDEDVLTTRVNHSLKQYANAPEPSFEQIKTASAAYVRRLEIDVCGLPELVPGYAQLISGLSAKEKLELFPGVHICFPSKATWDGKPAFRQEMIDVLRSGFVIDF